MNYKKQFLSIHLEGEQWNPFIIQHNQQSRFIILTVGMMYYKGKLGFTTKTPDSDFYFDSEAIARALRANVGDYYDPQFEELDDLDDANQKFYDYMKKVDNKVLGAVAGKNAQKQAVKDILDTALAYVNKLARNDKENSAEIVTGAKFQLVKTRSGGGKKALKVKKGKGTGKLDLFAIAVKIDAKYVRATYYFQYSTDDKKTWQDVGVGSHSSRQTANNMQIGVKTYFRVRSNSVKGGLTPWQYSEAVYPE